jgi:hydrogenase maturation protein HypF
MQLTNQPQQINQSQPQRLRLNIYGAVQGVGFRPFVYRLARELNLVGWVQNSVQGVAIEIEGTTPQLDAFLNRLEAEPPRQSQINCIEVQKLELLGDRDFKILASTNGDRYTSTAIMLSDLATCADCRREIFDPTDRRYHYPFTNCTNCGPRYSISTALPYDRQATSMQGFVMCAVCAAEYANPGDRRFHAQPNACSICGPKLKLFQPEDLSDRPSKIINHSEAAIPTVAAAIKQGKIVAVKGLGGFHLILDARNPAAVQRLRQWKNRPHKPLALMYPDLAQIQRDCHVSELESELLRSPAAPIVLLTKRSQSLPVCETVAPRNPYLGVMLPYTPLHHLFIAALGFPVVATSGNRPGETICIDNQAAIDQLSDIADLLILHDRPIMRPIDDSVVRVIAERPVILRRARGYAPMPIQLTSLSNPVENCDRESLASNPNSVTNTPVNILAVGAQQKNAIALYMSNTSNMSNSVSTTITAKCNPVKLAKQSNDRITPTDTYSLSNDQTAVATNDRTAYLASSDPDPDALARQSQPPAQIILSQYLGDLASLSTYENFQHTIKSLSDIYKFQPTAIACDAHPDYFSSQYAQQLAQQLNIPIFPIQHHYAHALAAMADNQITSPALGVAWDGTGYGSDRTIWGGEFLAISDLDWHRIATLRSFLLPGGNQAIKEPRRAALGLLFAIYGDRLWHMYDLLSLPTIQAFSTQELNIIKTMLDRQLNTPITSSMGRLFDAIASLSGLYQHCSFEGQAAMALEFSATQAEPTDADYNFAIVPTSSSNVQNNQDAQLVTSISAFNPSPGKTSTMSIDWQPMVVEILADIAATVSTRTIAAKFHNTLAEMIVAVAQRVGESKVILTGGCFQNKYLTERAIQRLKQKGFAPHWHCQIPPNDGSIAVGQIVATLKLLQKQEDHSDRRHYQSGGEQ